MKTKRIEGLIKSVHNRLQPLLDFDGFLVALHDPLRSVLEFPLTVQSGQPVERSTRAYQPEVWLLDSLIKTRPACLVEKDFAQAPGKDSLKYETEGALPLSWLAVPMIAENQVIGVLALENRRRLGAFGENDVRVLSSVARQAAVAIENARLVDQRDRKIANLRALYEMGQQLNSELRLTEDEITHLIYKQASQLMDTKNMYIALYDEKADEVSFPLMYVDGVSKRVDSRRGGQGRTEWIIRNKKPIFNATKAESQAWYQVPEHQEYISQPFASWVGVPMLVRDKVLGVIATYHITEDYAYTADDQEILQLMANQAAVAIENARLYSNREELVQERTRQLSELSEKVQELERMQSEIADRERALVMTSLAMDFVHEINNLAGTIVPWITLAKRSLSSDDTRNNKVIQYLDKTVRDAELMLQKAQEFRNPDIGPKKLNIEELTGSVIGQVSIMTSPDIDIVYEAEPELPSTYANERQLSTAIYSIIHNGVKAISGQGRVFVELKRNPTRDAYLQINISDTGCGIPDDEFEAIFDYGASNWPDGKGFGYGLWRARSILRSIKGDIQVTRSVLGQGSTFTIMLPVIQ